MKKDDYRAQHREGPEPEEGTYGVPRIVMVWIGVLLIWGAGYYAWQIGKPMQGGDSRTAAQPAQATDTVDGGAIFTNTCSACHQASGKGIPGAFPPLQDSEWVIKDPAFAIAIVHDGLEGPITVAGNNFQGVMPEFGSSLSSQELAAVLTYIRSEWGNSAAEVSAAEVEAHADKFGQRGHWSADELKDTFGDP